MLKIFIVTQEDPFYSPYFYKEFYKLFFNKLSKDVCIEGIYIQKPLGNKSLLGLIKRVWGLYGNLGFIKKGIEYFHYKFKSILFNNKLYTGNFSIRTISKNNNINVYEFESVNSNEFITFIKDKSIDLVVSVAASEIFKEIILSTPNICCINLHNAPLPKYRGMLPNFWQMYYDEKFSTLTIHKMVKELDKGDIIYQNETKIDKKMTLERLFIESKVNSAASLCIVIEKYVNNTIIYKPLPDIVGSYFTFPTRADVKKFRANGKKVI